jgi:hypothetical protein
MTTNHDLKTWNNYFQAVWDRDKLFEVRWDDRGYQKGDTVRLREWDHAGSCDCGSKDHADTCARYSGREITGVITYVIASVPARGAQRGLSCGYVTMSLGGLDNITRTLPTAPVDASTAIAQIAARRRVTPVPGSLRPRP